MATIKDVARMAGVSTATVSRVLTGNGPFTPDTRRKVMEAIEKLNYQPNGLGRYLRKQETRTVIVVLPDITNPFFSQIIRGMEDEALAHGFTVILGNTDNHADRQRNYVKLLEERRADGIILTAVRNPQPEIEAIQKIGPVVLACEYSSGMFQSVAIDNEQAAFEATSHLIRLGHKRIAHFAGPSEVVLSGDRLHGYQRALREHGIAEQWVGEGDFSLESGRRLMQKLLQANPRPTALFAASDKMAIGAILEAKLHGLKVPDDLAVVGFDDIEMAEVVDPPLTTIVQPKYQIGVEAMRKLITMLEGRPDPALQTILPHTLVIRRSCGGRPE
ncbi:LacI family DNA-binding transcriptional regulator [Effusibacillus pohliae]|uniref:LacI family DNA-binding transcriptional regulator n=1 Tax=Effusibacillus pohliae TaxID=232270 RepID=UPI00036EB2CF|nr:LacI family DNA-binding transcriptional regulator [Effusibacillus pohliae]